MGSQCLTKLLLLAISLCYRCLYVLPGQLGAICSECVTNLTNHLFYIQAHSLFVCFGQFLPAGDGGGGGEGGGFIADVAPREEESQTGGGGEWVVGSELAPLSFNMHVRQGSTSIGSLLRQ